MNQMPFKVPASAIATAAILMAACSSEHSQNDNSAPAVIVDPVTPAVMIETRVRSTPLDSRLTGNRMIDNAEEYHLLADSNRRDDAADARAITPGFTSAAESSMIRPAHSPRTKPHLNRDLLRLPPGTDRANHAPLVRNETIQTQVQPVSTFSIDVDTGAYANVRRYLNDGALPPRNAVRVEEMLNYFSYDYPDSESATRPFSITTEVGPTPWNRHTHLLHVGLQGRVPDTLDNTAANLVFLVDVSGSMNSADKLGLLKSSISMLARELDAHDTVSIVVYAGASGIALEPTPGHRHQLIDRALSRLRAGGSTNGAEGLELAYELAAANFKQGGINRIILATDGDFNVGLTDLDELKDLIARKRDAGLSLTTLGFGSGNYNDQLMEQLADVGNGNHAYIDTLGEARKVLVDELNATLLTIARDVRIQVEFNPRLVSEYRLIGYSNRALANEDFSNDNVDAGEIGAGHSVTALYEIALRGEGGERHSASRYATTSAPDTQSASTIALRDRQNREYLAREIAELRLRYRLPGEKHSRLERRQLMRKDIVETTSASSENHRFAAAVAAFGQLLQGDERLEEFDFRDVRKLAGSALGRDSFGYRAEFLRLVDTADSLDRLSRLTSDSLSRHEG